MKFFSNRLKQCFDNCASENRAAFISFISAGDPNLDISLQILQEMPKNGVDIIELGIPFSDPTADGPTIAQASQRAINGGYGINDIFHMVETFRKTNDETPIVLMGYYNSVLSFGVNEFFKKANELGVDATIFVDIPMEMQFTIAEYVNKYAIDNIQLLSPTTPKERAKKILQDASGFIYFVSITGITGTASAAVNDIKENIAYIRSITKQPIALGFGIKTFEQVQEMKEVADGVVIGSAIVQKIEDNLHLLNGANNDNNSIIVNEVLEHIKNLSSNMTKGIK